MPRPLATRAPAKINLTLHVLGRRADGYHELESLVAFAGTGDSLSLEPGTHLSLRTSGPMAALAGKGSDNLVLKAARLLAERVPGLQAGTFHLVKRLPVAAGIGGGSSDAAAALRLLARLNALPLSHPAVLEAARLTGADVPVCLEAKARMMSGIGDILGPPLRLPPLFAVLVNPRVPIGTSEVFGALGLEAGQCRVASDRESWPLAARVEFLGALRRRRNDLEPVARDLQPMVSEAIDLLSEEPACRLARMSGSGATVFGLFDDREGAEGAAGLVRSRRRDWWVRATVLR